MRIWTATTIMLLLPLAACGGAQSGKNGEPSDNVIRPVTQGQLIVAHYTTPDGMKGLVLDRTGGKFAVRLDGDDAIIQLTPEEDRHGGELRGHFLVTPDNRRMLYLSAYGGLTLFTDSDELHLLSDKAANPLGKPTVAGPPVKEKLKYELLGEELAAISVRVKNPALTSADASNLAKVAEALRAATPDMLVRYRAHEGNSPPSIEWTTSDVHGVGFGGGSSQSEEKWDRSKPGLARYGAVIKGYSEPDSRGNHLFVQVMEGYPPPLADGTPGLVWEVDSTTVVFVTPDGARYNVDCGSSAVDNGAPIEKGAGAPTGWPAPLQHSLVGITEVTALAKAGAVPTRVGDDLLAIDDEWNTCAQKVWKRAKKDIDRLKTADIDWSTRSGRAEALLEKWSGTVRKDCRPAASKLEKSLVQFIEDRNKERQSLFEAARARFAK
jgi:hypothetical protein